MPPFFHGRCHCRTTMVLLFQRGETPAISNLILKTMTRTFTVANIQNVYTTTLLDQFQMLDAQRTFSPIQDVVDASIEVMSKITKELDRRKA